MRRIEPQATAIAAIVVTVITTGCISALREPPPMEDMAATARQRGGDGRLAQAERLWSQRTLDSVQAAAEIFQASITEHTVQLEALLGAARARLWVADHHQDPEVRLAEAEGAIALSQWCGRVQPEEPHCDYLLALGLGLQARERRSTAIDGLPRVVQLLQSSIERAPMLDNAGPHRVLALLYMRAPGWPSGPGDLDRGYEHARLAVELDPGHPPNLMALGEAHRELDDIASSKAVFSAAERLSEELVEREVPDAVEWLELARRALERLERR